MGRDCNLVDDVLFFLSFLHFFLSLSVGKACSLVLFLSFLHSFLFSFGLFLVVCGGIY